MKFISALLNGLSGGQLLAAKGIAGIVAIAAIYFSVTAYGKAKFEAGSDSRNGYIEKIEGKLANEKSEVLRLNAELKNCQKIKDEQASRITALTDQNATAAETAAKVLLTTQKVNAEALAAASRNNSKNTDFNAILDAKLKGLKNECDTNGNGIVRNGADILRAVRNGQ